MKIIKDIEQNYTLSLKGKCPFRHIDIVMRYIGDIL